jgi:hypothetical protein
MVFGVWALSLMVLASRSLANDPFVYFAGNPANSWYTVGGACGSLTLTSNYLYLISGDVNSSGLPARWTALPFELCDTTTFDSIAYAPGLSTGLPIIRVIIAPARTGSDGRPEPDLANAVYDQTLGFYPGNPPILGEKDEQLRTYYGATTTFLYLRTTSLGTALTLDPGLYFAIIVGDEDFENCGPLDSSIALVMGAPGGPKLYYTPRGLGNNCTQPVSWQRFRYNTSVAPFTCERILNIDLPWRSGDPFANTPPWASQPDWNRYHSPNLYHGVLGLRYSGAASGKVTGTATLADAPSPAPPTNVEVIFYKPGTKQRVARFSMPTAAGPDFPIDTPLVAEGTYDIVVRPIYSPSILTVNCPTSICVTNVTFDPNTHWLGVRIPNVNVSGTVDLGTVILPNGDANGDGQVDDADLLNVLFAFGGTDAAADLNGDNTVDDADLLIVLFNFGAQGEDGDEACGS